ncbi:hypothetical protein TNCV_1212121 [Trichonephila clavipes]|nr:hypothetical protein TNCV_1212121 [Trichonephila clavipes]
MNLWVEGPNRKFLENSNYRVTKRALSSNESVLQKYRRKRSKQDTVAVTRYNLRPRDGREVESRPSHREDDTTGRTRSIQKRQRKERQPLTLKSEQDQATRMPDEEVINNRQDQERKGTCTRKSLSLEVLVGNANYKS